MFLLRACGQYQVRVGEGEHGQALANSLVAAQVGASTKLRAAGFRQRMTQRLAVGLAGPYWGVNDKFSLSAADFIAYTDAELDQFASEARMQRQTGEQRPPPPNRFDEWVARVRRQNDVWCLVYGEEWRAVRSNAVELLSNWHLSHPHRWPLNVVMDVWEEVHWRFLEELKDILRRLKKEIGRETITLNELRFHALLPGPDGQAWLQMPDTFDLEKPSSWFQTEVLPRIDRKQERLLWNLTWQGGARRDRPNVSSGGPMGVSDTMAGSGGGEKPTLKSLWGPKLTPEEVSQAKDRAPQDKNGKLLCWGHLCHVGCSISGCQRSHDGLRGAFESLDPCVQMQLLRRGGLKRMKIESVDSVTGKIKELRAKMQKDKAEKIQDGSKRTKRAGTSTSKTGRPEEHPDGDHKQPEEAHAGGDQRRVRFWDVPEEFKVDYTKEEDLQHLVKGPETTWTLDAYQPQRVHPGRQGESAPAEARRLVEAAQRLQSHPALQLLEGASDDLYAWASARIARDPTTGGQDLLTEMATYGMGELAKEAAEILETMDDGKAGSARLRVHDTVWAPGRAGRSVVEIDGQEWTSWDFQEDIMMTEELAALLKVPEACIEKRQCVTVTIAALVAQQSGRSLPSPAEVRDLAQELRVEQTRLASEAATVLGEPEEMVAAVEHEIRMYVHDLLTVHHEKDFRTLAVFPVGSLACCRLVVLRADYKGGLVVESVVGPLWEPDGWTAFALIWKGHMTLLEPPFSGTPGMISPRQHQGSCIVVCASPQNGRVPR